MTSDDDDDGDGTPSDTGLLLLQARQREAGLLAQVQELRAQLAALEQARDGARADILSFSRAVAHDVKGPIGAVGVVIKNLSTAEGDRVSASARRMLQLVGTECDRMVQLVDDVATLGIVLHRELRLEPVALQPLVESVLVQLRAPGAADRAAAASSAAVRMPPAPGLPLVHGDALLLRLVWQHLLANALKFTSKADAPRVELRCQRNADSWKFVVADNGAGFDMAHVGRLFGLFQRLHKASDYPGTGVGLAIVQRALQRLGGQVWAVSAPGQGAELHFTLPASGQTSASSASGASGPPCPSGSSDPSSPAAPSGMAPDPG